MYKEDDLAVSLITGFNIYSDTEKSLRLFPKQNAEILRHEQSGEYYYAVRLKDDLISGSELGIKNKWERLIKHPCPEPFMWPVDIVTMGNAYFLIFDTVPDAGYMSLHKTFDSGRDSCISEKNMQRIIKSYIAAYISLSAKSYLFLGLDDNNIFVNIGSGKLLIFANNHIDENLDQIILYKKKDYFSPTTDPYGYINRDRDILNSDNDIYQYDAFSQEYAFAALLFRMMVGCYPYEGPYMSGYDGKHPDNNWINHYLLNPVFIFDTEDTSNSVKPFRYNRKIVSKWLSLSAELQMMFRNTFREHKVLRRNVSKYPAKAWKAAADRHFDALNKEENLRVNGQSPCSDAVEKGEENGAISKGLY